MRAPLDCAHPVIVEWWKSLGFSTDHFRKIYDQLPDTEWWAKRVPAPLREAFPELSEYEQHIVLLVALPALDQFSPQEFVRWCAFHGLDETTQDMRLERERIRAALVKKFGGRAEGPPEVMPDQNQLSPKELLAWMKFYIKV